MNVARLLQDSPSDDHRQRQELREKLDRDREREQTLERDRGWDRDRERDADREREREQREWDREREANRDWSRESASERAQRDRNSLSSSSAAHPPTHRSYPSIDPPPRPGIHEYDGGPTLAPHPSRSASNQNQNNNVYSRSPRSDSVHPRSYSQEGRHASSMHSQLHSPPPPSAPSFLSPLTAPREATAAGPVPGMAPSSASPEHPADYPHRAKNTSRQTHGKTPPMFSQRDRDRDREREYELHRTRSLSGSGRPRTPPPYGDPRDVGRTSPTTARLGHRQHSPAQGSYSVVPPAAQSHAQQHFSLPHPGSRNNSNASIHSSHSAQGPPLSRRAPPLPAGAALPPPPSASRGYSHDSNGAPTPSAMSRQPVDELPYPARAPSSSSSGMNTGRTLKEDIERESLEREREQRERERERERELRERDREHRGRELQRHTSSRSASAGAHPSPPSAIDDRMIDRGREMGDVEKMRDMEAIRAVANTRMQGQPRDVRERDALRHHHHHHHHHAFSHSHSHPGHNMHPQHQHHLQQAQQQAQQQQQQLPHVPGTPYTYAHTGKPRISRSGVLKLAPPGVTVQSNVPPSSSDLIFAGASGVVMRTETLSLAPSSHPHGSQHQQMQSAHSGASGPQPIEPIPVNVKQPSPPQTNLHRPSELYHENSHAYEVTHGKSHLQQYPSQSGKHRPPYSVVPTGPGVPPPNAGPQGPPDVQASMMAAQQQHAQQFGPMSAHQQMQHAHSHSQSLPPPSQPHPLSSPGSMHAQGHPHMHPSPYRVPPPHQGYPPPPMHYNEVPPPPVPMALQPMPAPSPPMQEPLAEPPVHLGTFIFPNTPFPYFFPARTNSDSRRAPNISPGQSQSKKSTRQEPDHVIEHRDRTTHVTILVPSTHLPSSLPTDGRPRIWGGTPLPVIDPWGNYTNFANRSSAGARRLYTDDSNIALCALHSGRVSLPGLQRARKAGLDLSIRLALYRDIGRYIGGVSAFADGGAAEGAPDVDVGLKQLLNLKSSREIGEDVRLEDVNWLETPSASWTSGNDGSGIEVLSAEWMPRGSTRKLGLKNRSQRLREYTERRRVIMKEISPDTVATSPRSSSNVLGKRPSHVLDFSCKLIEDEEMSGVRTILFGNYHGVESAGFKYDPVAMNVILFPTTSPSRQLDTARDRGRRKRRKLNHSRAHSVASALGLQSEADTDGEYTSGRSRRSSPSPRQLGNAGVILENSEDRYLLVQQDSSLGTDEDKENCQSAAMVEGKDALVALGKSAKGRRYDLYTLPSRPSSAMSNRAASPKTIPVMNGSCAAKSEVEPMTPKSNNSAPGSPRDANKGLEITHSLDLTDKKVDEGKAKVGVADETPSELPVTKPVGIPTPPATTATLHASSPLLPSNDVRDRSERTIVPHVLYRNLGAEDFQFLDNGISFTSTGRLSLSENGTQREGKVVYIPVDRWRWAGTRDRLANSSLSSNGGSSNKENNAVTAAAGTVEVAVS
ncbi:uncharacterized protein FOMMEDRAFT_164472 [Fomitiporia mediterranea MF3/22]|uniref:uncharacterized protein n=1 Tax=Fomitiporia mediterranea (strain MF3/22) TaxID=694068 RepID=UPI0004407BE6|nr:uncharacterized protein FOMMEDRAFT_164472 [Fomitiporia mediterranea MF3/22]EJD07521.1 hypothetical protein FOMMEDRAFT_164472 [Fomitiporia mediterranea MF3/22]